MTKFLTGITLFNFFAFYLMKTVGQSVWVNSFIGQNENLLSSGPMGEFFNKPLVPHFFEYYFRGLFGDWGYSSQTGEVITDTIFELIWYSLPSIGIIVSFILILSYLTLNIVTTSTKSKFNTFVTYFRGNWIVFATTLIIPLFLVQFLNPSSYIYDGYLHRDTLFSPAYVFSMIILIFLGYGKTLSNISLLPLSMPTNQTDQINNGFPNRFGADQVKNNLWSIVLIGFKSSIVSIVEYMFIVHTMLNLPGLPGLFFRSLLFIDVPMVLATIFFVLFFVYGVRMLIDILLILLPNMYTEQSLLGNRILETDDSLLSQVTTKTGKAIGGYFVATMLISGIIWFFIGFGSNSLRFLYFWPIGSTASQMVNENINLGLLSKGHLLGTDHLGRDLFSMLIFGTSNFIVPIVLSCIFRPIIVYGIEKVLGIIDNNLSFHVFDLFEGIPKYMYLILFAFLPIFANLPSFVGFSLLVSLIFWGRVGKLSLYLRAEKSNGYSLNHKPMQHHRIRSTVLYSTLTVIIELFLVNFYFLEMGEFSWGRIVDGVMSNYPTEHLLRAILIVLYPLVIIFGLYLFVDSYVRQQPPEQINADEIDKSDKLYPPTDETAVDNSTME